MAATPYASGLFAWDTSPLPVPVREAGLPHAHLAKAEIFSSTRTSQILAELLDSAAATQLQHALIKNSHSLKQAFAALPAQQQSQLRETFGVQTLGTFFSIASDPNDNSAALGLLSLADGFAAQGKTDWAATVYQELQSSHFSETVTQRAHAGQQALMGQGPIVPRLSLAIRQSKDQIVNGPMLASIVVGGASFKLFRSLLTGPLFPAGTFMAPIPYWTTRGLMNGAAVLGESSVFVAAHKAIDWGLGNEVHFSREEFLSTTGMLASLRLAGAFMGAVGRGLVAGGVGLPYLPQALGVAGMYGGIVGAQLIDQHVLKIIPATGVDWFGAGVTLSHFIGAGYLLKHIHRMMPESFQKWEARMEQRVADALDRSKPCLPSLVSQIVTTTGHVLPNWGNVGPGHEHIVRAQSLPPVFDPATTTDSATATPTPVSAVVARPAPRLLRPVPDALPLPAELVQEVQQWDARMAADGAYLRSVGQVASQAPEATAAALRRLHLILDTFYPAELFERGSYVDTLTFVAFDTSRFQGIPAQFLGEMLDFLYRGGRVIDYERLLAPWVRQLMPPFQPAQLAHYPKLSGKLDQLDLDRISKRVLGENIERALGGARLRQSKQTENQQGHEEVANQLRVLEAQLRALRRQLEIPEHKDLIQVALNLASYSPMAGLRTLRLLDIVQRHDADAVTVKLRELGDPQAVMVGMGYGPRPPLPAEIAGTQWAGYFTDPHIVRLFRGYHLHTAEALSLERTAQRRAQRDKALTAFWQGRDPRRPLSRQDLVHSLRLLKDPWSTETAQKIESGELPTEILYPTEFETEIKSERFNFKPNQLALHHPERWTAAYAPPQTPGGKGAMLLRQPNYPNASSDPAELNARLARWQSSAIHEGGFHDGHIQALSVEKRTPGVVLRHEVYAHGGQRLWQAYHGDLSGLDLMNLGTQGLAMFVRNDVERVEFPRKPSESS